MPLPALADEISEDVLNGLFAPLTILEDHPQCQGPGETAFEVEFDAPDIAFRARVRGATRQELLYDQNGLVVGTERRCFVQQRRGVEVMDVQVNCDGGAETEILAQPYDFDRIALRVTGAFTVCQSPFAFSLLESNWTAVSDGPLGTVTTEGEVFTVRPEGCQDATPYDEPALLLEYSHLGATPFRDVNRLRFFQEFGQVQPEETTHFRLFFQDLPIIVDDAGEVGATANTGVYLFPTASGRNFCHDNLCDLNRLSGMEPYVGQLRTCP